MNKETLMYAANATGKKWQWVTCPKYGNMEVPGLLFVDRAHEVDYYFGWNPLLDSKDAFELAVLLKLQLSTPHEWFTNNSDHLVCTAAWFDENDEEHWKSVDFKLSEGDPISAMRLAITQAAAEIGKKMQNNLDVSDAAMVRARYAIDKVKYSTDKVNQINFAAQELPEVAVMVGANQKMKTNIITPSNWQPIATAPKDNKRALYLARFDESGNLLEIDFDGTWDYWEESWEMSHINSWDWSSANGIENPTHWAFQE